MSLHVDQTPRFPLPDLPILRCGPGLPHLAVCLLHEEAGKGLSRLQSLVPGARDTLFGGEQDPAFLKRLHPQIPACEVLAPQTGSPVLYSPPPMLRGRLQPVLERIPTERLIYVGSTSARDGALKCDRKCRITS